MQAFDQKWFIMFLNNANRNQKLKFFTCKYIKYVVLWLSKEIGIVLICDTDMFFEVIIECPL